MFAPKRFGAHPPARGEASIRLCDACRKKTKVEDLLTDEGFKQVCAAFKQIGSAMPDRSRTQIDWVPIETDN